MAYSGLGGGTDVNPYQITTPAQFKEINSSDYAGAFSYL